MNNHGFLKVAAASPKVKVADCVFNTQEIITTMQLAQSKQVAVLVFPELCITAYTCGDLFLQQTLLDEALTALRHIAKTSETLDIVSIVGLPLRVANGLYNVAAIVHNGSIAGIIPKTYLPNRGEFYEKRWFSSGAELADNCTIAIPGIARTIPVAVNMIFELQNYCYKFGVEICEDLWTAIPPSSFHALSGADIIFNLSASNEVIGKQHYRRDLVLHQSARTLSGYVYASAAVGESTTDLVFSGSCIITENGTLLAENKEMFSLESQLIISDIDVDRLRQERLRNKSFVDNLFLLDKENKKNYTIQYLSACAKNNSSENITKKLSNLLKEESTLYQLNRFISDTPFLPKEPEALSQVCSEMSAIQTAAICKRLLHTGIRDVVIGVSGGLDSTLALLILITAYDKLGINRENIHAVTMPGFGTSDRTYTNALKLMKELGVNSKEIPIRKAVLQHFKDIGHNSEIHDVTYENAQARERTQILMDYANKVNGLVVGTGDLSELALGWCTYNGDQMSMYGLNAGVPKTLVKASVAWFAGKQFTETKVRNILLDIVNTPVSPELLPATEQGQINQITEDTVGPYILHDFFIYYVIRYGFSPSKIYFLAQYAFGDVYSGKTILKWMQLFYRRFFTQQFKRSCMPDGPKVGAVSLSPRGDWRMPSDASYAAWLSEIEQLIQECGITSS